VKPIKSFKNHGNNPGNNRNQDYVMSKETHIL
jgi:hypothetical protein